MDDRVEVEKHGPKSLSSSPMVPVVSRPRPRIRARHDAPSRDSYERDFRIETARPNSQYQTSNDGDEHIGASLKELARLFVV